MIYILLPVGPTPAIEKTDDLLKVKGMDGYGSLTWGWGGGVVNFRSLTDW